MHYGISCSSFFIFLLLYLITIKFNLIVTILSLSFQVTIYVLKQTKSKINVDTQNLTGGELFFGPEWALSDRKFLPVRKTRNSRSY